MCTLCSEGCTLSRALARQEKTPAPGSNSNTEPKAESVKELRLVLGQRNVQHPVASACNSPCSLPNRTFAVPAADLGQHRSKKALRSSPCRQDCDAEADGTSTSVLHTTMLTPSHSICSQGQTWPGPTCTKLSRICATGLVVQCVRTRAPLAQV